MTGLWFWWENALLSILELSLHSVAALITSIRVKGLYASCVFGSRVAGVCNRSPNRPK